MDPGWAISGTLGDGLSRIASVLLTRLLTSQQASLGFTLKARKGSEGAGKCMRPLEDQPETGARSLLL